MKNITLEQLKKHLISESSNGYYDDNETVLDVIDVIRSFPEDQDVIPSDDGIWSVEEVKDLLSRYADRLEAAYNNEREKMIKQYR
jgi:hypothetical protein